MSSTRVPRLPARIARPASAMAKRIIGGGVRAQPQPQPSKIGPLPSVDRNVATAPEPAAAQGQAEARTYVQTYFTKIQEETQILYNGDRQWARVTLTLETAGPVAVGTVQKITPVNSGKGILLPIDEPVTIDVAKGTRLYVTSAAVSRIKMQVAPLPWLEQITGILRHMAGRALGKA